MADRIIKPDSGNDVVVQNNAGTRKIEVTNSGDVEVTGDFKATTVKATNLKANDGTASLEIADSTGDIGFSGNTNLKFKLPSAGGIFESDGSTEILTESSGSVSLRNVNNVYQTTFLERTTNGLDVSGTTETSISSETFVNKKGGSSLYIEVFFQVQVGRVSGGAGDTGLRYADFRLYQNSSTVTQNATSGFGTEIARRIAGRQSDNSTTVQASYVPVCIAAECTTNGSANQNNLFSITCTGSGSLTRTELFCTSAFPIIFKFTEIA